MTGFPGYPEWDGPSPLCEVCEDHLATKIVGTTRVCDRNGCQTVARDASAFAHAAEAISEALDRIRAVLRVG